MAEAGEFMITLLPSLTWPGHDDPASFCGICGGVLAGAGHHQISTGVIDFPTWVCEKAPPTAWVIQA